MEYINLGRTGLKVSRLCLGCMSYGEPDRLPQPWSLGEDDSRPLIRQALEAGINFFDTANVYSGGSSEEIVGRAIRDMAKRDEVVIATKAFFPLRNAPNNGFLSRKALFQAIDDSLSRLGMDYVDLYQIHRFDHSTPVEETMEALHDIVKAGKVRYIGASSMEAWRFAKMQHTAEKNGWTRFVSMQPQYNLLYREEEREMLPQCLDQGVGVIPWSPMARGRLTRDWDENTTRSENDAFALKMYQNAAELPTSANKTLWENKCINASLIAAMCGNAAPFRKDKRGSTPAVRATLQTFCDYGYLQLVNSKTAIEQFQYAGRAYAIIDPKWFWEA